MYVRQHYRCDTCPEAFEFSPKEQAFWYEDLQLFVDIRPTSCTPCRKKIRSYKRNQKRLGQLLKIGKNLTTDNLEEIANIYQEMGHEAKAQMYFNRVKNKKDRGE